MAKKSDVVGKRARSKEARKKVEAQVREAYDGAIARAREVDGKVVAPTPKAREAAVAQAMKVYDNATKRRKK